MHIVHLTVPVVFVFSTMVNVEHSGSECIFEEMPERTVYAPKLHFVVTIEENNMRIGTGQRRDVVSVQTYGQREQN